MKTEEPKLTQKVPKKEVYLALGIAAAGTAYMAIGQLAFDIDAHVLLLWGVPVTALAIIVESSIRKQKMRK
jgi:hypothetical protein